MDSNPRGNGREEAGRLGGATERGGIRHPAREITKNEGYGNEKKNQ